MEFIPYRNESEYDSAKNIKKINIKLGRTAILSKSAEL